MFMESTKREIRYFLSAAKGQRSLAASCITYAETYERRASELQAKLDLAEDERDAVSGVLTVVNDPC